MFVTIQKYTVYTGPYRKKLEEQDLGQSLSLSYDLLMFASPKDHKIMFRLLFSYILSNIGSDPAIVSTKMKSIVHGTAYV